MLGILFKESNLAFTDKNDTGISCDNVSGFQVQQKNFMACLKVMMKLCQCLDTTKKAQ
jgi:hypothetical protein